MKTTCFICGKKLVTITTGPKRGQLAFTTINYHGTDVVTHEVCDKSYQRKPYEPVNDQRRETDFQGNYRTRPVGSNYD